MNEAGMACVGKHFPGHGSISEDSHIEKPIDQRTLNEIENKDLIPFKELINNLDGIMTAHILFSEVDTRIATFSKVWIKQILKEQMKFEGMIFSDDLSMEGTNEFISFYDKTKNAINSEATNQPVFLHKSKPACLSWLTMYPNLCIGGICEKPFLNLCTLPPS